MHNTLYSRNNIKRYPMYLLCHLPSGSILKLFTVMILIQQGYRNWDDQDTELCSHHL